MTIALRVNHSESRPTVVDVVVGIDVEPVVVVDVQHHGPLSSPAISLASLPFQTFALF
ncbi:MAG: hypothetical protein HY363_05270 [Candidatus Aenigmarchaeota archaeon]|nr:hypothetical protein [Candidatus Aenigmarchaeota archaeon]